ncbi:MAG TPA: acylphosphatase [Syntrophales bacterium]|nr:acylphosphatase [Syntrophales bacterium]HON23596.1 acylphosphatase [Syntrophales bacterium]HOU77129.1 acylphosphatase [Syntrophales bacterium]HPC33707.1 acylphosphatase [Syntrophales bacterium]HQG33657.1 acylphosphatase [Syntrophales bacterium]
MRRVRVNITGRVQGVAFRAWTQQTARSLTLTGWVKNLPDGSVTAVFEGKGQQVEIMIRRCALGPPLAGVEKVTVTEETYQGAFTDFFIRYD